MPLAFNGEQLIIDINMEIKRNTWLLQNGGDLRDINIYILKYQ